MITEALLDMDGVLVDFVKGACAAHGRPDYVVRTWDFYEDWGIAEQEFWSVTNNVDFWASLEKTPEADAFVDAAFKRFGKENVAILTAPSSSPYSIIGKQVCVDRLFPELRKRVIFAKAKTKKFIAGSNRVLLDDKESNCEEFVQAGGTAILVPRTWNHLIHEADRAKDFVLDKLEVFCSKN